MFMTAMIVIRMWAVSADVPLYEAGQVSAPVCVNVYCMDEVGQ